ncbi:MAG: hypothetical protein IPP83_05175 [Flavobacteriales bacterium]|nr:hypothetical protein [Flavobacteriales bacterium]
MKENHPIALMDDQEASNRFSTIPGSPPSTKRIVHGDVKYGVLDDEHFLIVRKDGRRSLYAYRTKSTLDEASAHPDVVERMDRYARAHMQTFQHVTHTNKQ